MDVVKLVLSIIAIVFIVSLVASCIFFDFWYEYSL